MALTSKETNEIIKNKTIRAASKRRTATKVIIVVLLISLLLTGGTYGVISLIEANSMTISVNREKSGLALCETRKFDEPTAKLLMGGPEKMDATTYPWIDLKNNAIGYEGKHHGLTYIGYSFYLKNVNMSEPCTYTMQIKLLKNTKNIAAALRILLVEYEELTKEQQAKGELDVIKDINVYAKSREDGTAEYISYDDCKKDQRGITLSELNFYDDLLKSNMTVPFGAISEEEESLDVGYSVTKREEERLSPEAIRKYTVVIWFEGTDLQCVNDILGGKCTIDVNFELKEYLSPEYYG